MNYKLIIGCDVSKLTLDVSVITTEHPEKHLHKVFTNNVSGFQSILKWIEKVFSEVQESEILFCAEHIGIYAYALTKYLKENNIAIWLESPLHIKRSLGLQRGKSDKLDAKRIADFAFAFKHKAILYKLPSDVIMQLKNLMAYRERLVKMNTTFKITSKLMKQLPKPIRADITKQSDNYIKKLTKDIEQLDQRLFIIVKSDAELMRLYTLITSIIGIGKQIAIAIIIYTNGFTKFTSYKKFACYCGVAPFEYSSGTSIKGKTRVNNLANKKLKSILTMAALNTIRHDSEFKAYYLRRTADGKNAMSTINIIKNKLISRVFAVVKRGSAYIAPEDFLRAA